MNPPLTHEPGVTLANEAGDLLATVVGYHTAPLLPSARRELLRETILLAIEDEFPSIDFDRLADRYAATCDEAVWRHAAQVDLDDPYGGPEDGSWCAPGYHGLPIRVIPLDHERLSEMAMQIQIEQWEDEEAAEAAAS